MADMFAAPWWSEVRISAGKRQCKNKRLAWKGEGILNPPPSILAPSTLPPFSINQVRPPFKIWQHSTSTKSRKLSNKSRRGQQQHQRRRWRWRPINDLLRQGRPNGTGLQRHLQQLQIDQLLSLEEADQLKPWNRFHWHCNRVKIIERYIHGAL